MGFSRQEYRSELPFPPPGDPPDPGSYIQLIHFIVQQKVTQHCKATAAAAKSLQSCLALAHQAPPWDSPGRNTGVSCYFLLQCMKVKSESEVAQSCPTLSDPMDWSPPGSSVHGILQGRVLEWVAIAFSMWSNYTSRKKKYEILFTAEKNNK